MQNNRAKTLILKEVVILTDLLKRAIIKNIDGKECAVFRFVDNTSIPFDPANTDYQKYLNWGA